MKTTKTFFILLAGTLLSCDAIFPPVPNSDYCTNDNAFDVCPSGTVCDLEKHACLPINNACTDSSMCSSVLAAACPVETKICRPCEADNQCISWTTTHNSTIKYNYCRTITPPGMQTPNNTCVECWPKNVQGSTAMEGKCTADPLKPACDIDSTGHGTGLCRGCVADSECDSGICRKAGDYPTNSTLQTGQCVDPGQVVYVNNNTGSGCSDTGTGTQTTPFCTLTKALGGSAPYINLAPSTTTYGSATVASGTKIIYGPGATASPPATLDQVMVNGGNVTLLGVKVQGAGTTPTLTCSGQSSSVFIAKSLLTTPGNTRVIEAIADCGQLTIDRSLVNCAGGIKHGLIVGNNGSNPTKYRIVNSGFAGCGNSLGMGELYTVVINASADGVFAFNNVTGNYYAMSCSSGQFVYDSIMVGNTDGGNGSGCHPGGNNITTKGTIDFDAAALPKLRATQQNLSAVVDKGIDPQVTPGVTSDYDGNLRPQGSQYDIGMQEFM